MTEDSAKNYGGNSIVPETLTEENYEYWKRCLKSYLIGHGLWGVVSGKEIEPQKEQKKEHDEWKKKNAMALHAIQLSCGSGIYSNFSRARVSARHAWMHLAEKASKSQPQQPSSDDHEADHVQDNNGSTEHLTYEKLYHAIERGNWHGVEDIILHNTHALRARISSHKDTPLHIAILLGKLEIAEKLVSKMEAEDLELKNEYGATGLSLAAISGETKLAKAMVNRNKNLVTITSNEHEDGQLPVIVAALYGKKHMVHYLYKVTPKYLLSPEHGKNGVTLLNCLITAEIYDIASMLLRRYPILGITSDHNGNYALRILAHKPSAFRSGTKLSFWEKCIYFCIRVHSPWDSYHTPQDEEHVETQTSVTDEQHHVEIRGSSEEEDETDNEVEHKGITATKVLSWFQTFGWDILRCFVPEINKLHHRKLVHIEAEKLLICMFHEMRTLSRSQLEKMDIDTMIYDAIKYGIVEFIREMLKYKPEIVWKKDKRGRTIFSHAIVLRQEKIFSLIYGLGTQKSIMARRHDIFRNNYLHLAAKLSPPPQLERVSGAALQMQRELQWFKEVESIAQPKLKEEVNENNKTPTTLFSDEHKKLLADAESWMKSTAGSSMIVGTLIAAVMFTTAFTVPGGNKNDDGLPTMLESQPRPFFIFMISNALSMFSSTTSLLMFLGILTSRYAEEDFLSSLPTKLIFGLACLFFSIVTMMTSFGAALYLILHKSLSWVTVPIIVLSVIPIALFSILQFPLLIEMANRTYGNGIFDKPKKRFKFFFCFGFW